MGRILHAAAAAALLLAAAVSAQEPSVARGEYLVHAGGCLSCHTSEADDAIPLAGGRALRTPFGVFHAPNITPDRETGIGRWSDQDFVNALWEGVGPDSRYYFPAFPYTAYTGLSHDDVLSIKAYLFSLDPVRQENRPHELPWYLDTRLAAAGWQLLNFSAARFTPDTQRPDSWNRGAYLVRHLGHCGECHTPRNALGALLADRELGGTGDGPDGKPVPNISPHREAGIGRWSADEIVFFLEIGMLPSGDFAGAGMGDVIDDNTSQLTAQDRAAIAEYIQSLPALADQPVGVPQASSP